MSIAHNYEVDLNWLHDRLGVIYSPDLNDEINVATPPQFPKGIEKVWSPEHLLVAAVNSCLMTTFLAIAENSKLEYKHFTSKASGKLEMVDGKYLISEITLKPLLTINDEADREKSELVLRKSEKACLISNSIKSTIIFEPEVRVSNAG
jgi:peroxiredoxin-like protein